MSHARLFEFSVAMRPGAGDAPHVTISSSAAPPHIQAVLQRAIPGIMPPPASTEGQDNSANGPMPPLPPLPDFAALFGGALRASAGAAAAEPPADGGDASTASRSNSAPAGRFHRGLQTGRARQPGMPRLAPGAAEQSGEQAPPSPAVERFRRISGAIAGSIFQDLLSGAFRPGFESGPPPASEQAMQKLVRGTKPPLGAQCSVCLAGFEGAAEKVVEMPCGARFRLPLPSSRRPPPPPATLLPIHATLTSRPAARRPLAC